jgi:hypothetical protein
MIVYAHLKYWPLLFLLFLINIIHLKSEEFIYSTILEGEAIFIFNGIPVNEGWGEDLVYSIESIDDEPYTIGPLGGIPLVDIWNKTEGVAFFNTSIYMEPFSIRLIALNDSILVEAKGGSHIEVYKHTGDYFEAVREFALRMKSKGLYVKSAPEWAFDPIWETYGFEEDWNKNTVLNMIPLLKELGIKTITLDSGWYGQGRGDDWDSYTGDFEVNPDVIGTEQDFIDFINYLHGQGFRVRIWWIPGVAEKETDLHRNHPEWFYSKVIPSWGDTSDTGDWYLDPANQGVIDWNNQLIHRFLSYGVDGFKQDDIYHIVTDDSLYHQLYADLICNNYDIVTTEKPDFVINTCNCGLAQNFYHMSGQNQIIISDPVGSRQFRYRAKYMHALNVNGAAILGDHVELTQGDVGPDELDESGFYDRVDFSSIVPLGMVFETKFRSDPGQNYRKWLGIYTSYQFYNMEWINIPLFLGQIETYLMKDNSDLYFSFFTPEENQIYQGNITLSHLKSGQYYSVYDIVNEKELEGFTAEAQTHNYSVDFKHSLILRVSPVTDVKEKNKIGIKYFNLYQNYPNPFNSNTEIPFQVNKTSRIVVKIYNVQGREISVLIDKECAPGIYKINFLAERLTSGIYFCWMTTGTFSDVRKMILLK